MKRTARKARYVHAPQFEFPMDSGFCLIGERGEDGERISRERDRNAVNSTTNTQPELFPS